MDSILYLSFKIDLFLSIKPNLGEIKFNIIQIIYIILINYIYIYDIDYNKFQ